MFPIVRASVYKNPFIGLFMRATDNFLLVGSSVPSKTVELASSTLGVKPLSLFINQSPLVGLFTAANSKGVVVTASAEKRELDLFKQAGLNVCTLKAFAPGNNILCNDRAAIVNPAIHPAEVRKIGDCLGVEVIAQSITRAGLLGSCNVVTNHGLLAYNDITEVEFKRLQQVFGVSGTRGSINMGSSCNSYGAVANSNGAVVGESTSGFEVQRVYDALSH